MRTRAGSAGWRPASSRRSRCRADDLVQDTWVAALRRPPDLDRPARPWPSRAWCATPCAAPLARRRGRTARCANGRAVAAQGRHVAAVERRAGCSRATSSSRPSSRGSRSASAVVEAVCPRGDPLALCGGPRTSRRSRGSSGFTGRAPCAAWKEGARAGRGAGSTTPWRRSQGVQAPCCSRRSRCGRVRRMRRGSASPPCSRRAGRGGDPPSSPSRSEAWSLSCDEPADPVDEARDRTRPSRVVPAGWAAQEGAPERHVAGVASCAPGCARVANALVRLTVEASPARELRTDDAGRFDFGSEAAHPIALGAAVPETLAAMAHLGVRAATRGSAGLELELQPCVAGIAGKVTDAGGNPIAHAQLLREDAIGTETDASGAYALCTLPTAPLVAQLDVVVRADGWLRRDRGRDRRGGAHPSRLHARPRGDDHGHRDAGRRDLVRSRSAPISA